MTAKSAKRNFGYLLAGAILFTVIANTLFELSNSPKGVDECPCILTP